MCPLSSALLPQGLVIEENFISEAQEQAIVEYFQLAENEQAWETKIRRRVQHYGYEFNYQSLTHNAKSNGECVRPIPAELQLAGLGFSPTASDGLGVNPTASDGLGVNPTASDGLGVNPTASSYNQLTVNEYQPGALQRGV
jgi:hypothetical protein